MHAAQRGTARLFVAAAVALLSLTACGGGDLAMTADGPAANTRADGQTPAVINVTVKRGTKEVDDTANGQLKFSTDKGQFVPFDPTAPANTQDDPESQQITVPVSSGAGRAQLYSLHSGTATVTISYSDDNQSTAKKTISVVFGNGGGSSGSTGSTVSTIQYQGADPDAISLAGSGGVTSTQVTFLLLDSSGSPVPDGVTAQFTLSQTPGGASVTPTSAVTSNGDGTVRTVLSAGTIPGTVKVTCTVGSVSQDSSPITIAGGGVNFRNFSLVCDAYSIAGFEYFGLSNTCTVFAADVNGQYVPNNQVTLLTEAGGVPTHITTEPPPDPGEDNRGRATFPYQTQCPIPRDVTPDADDTYHQYVDADGGGGTHNPEAFFNQCHKSANGSVQPQYESRTLNQRDGLAALVAYTIGEECYNDLNGNGKFDPGEEDNANCDLGEPFLDENDNGQWDGPGVDPMIPEGEPFYDYDNNGTWTGPDGKWDAQWPIWRSVFITWTGAALVDPTSSANSKNGHAAVYPAANLGTVSDCVSHSFNYVYADVNGNVPTAIGDDDNIILDCGSTRCTTEAPTYSYVPSGFTTAQSGFPAGLPFKTIGYNDTYTCDGDPPPPGFSINLNFTATLSTAGSDTVGNTAAETVTGVATGTYQD